MSHYVTIKGIGNPVAYFPKLGIYLDSVTAGVFLCQMIYWHDKTENELGVYKTSDEIKEETGLSYREQVTARKKLVSLGLIEETNKRLEHKIYFKFMPDVFDEWLSGCLGIEIPERRKRISGNAENAVRRTTKTHFVLQENTQENTTKSVANTPDEILNIWKPKIEDLNAWLRRSGEMPLTENLIEQVLLEFNPYYESRYKLGSVTENQMYSNFVKWVKRGVKLNHATSDQQIKINENVKVDMGSW